MRKLRTFLALCLAAALWPATILAQEAATVTGRVTRDGGAPVPSANVRIVGTSLGTVTGEDGTYRLT
ncbi:MAG TPA: carboxypeptidase regulatory-like domain-containing protein, partial [Longimicrobiaceae bacterium]|nr:carboxypeptidase regulatory-like domain-containing protein [Longimicrobiaceae bacterium]